MLAAEALKLDNIARFILEKTEFSITIGMSVIIWRTACPSFVSVLIWWTACPAFVSVLRDLPTGSVLLFSWCVNVCAGGDVIMCCLSIRVDDYIGCGFILKKGVRTKPP